MAPPTRPIMVATARPPPLPMALPAAPPAMAPISAPAPDLGACVMTASLVQTWRGTATCCTTGVVEITRAKISMAVAGMDARAATATVEPVSVVSNICFMSNPLSADRSS